MFMLVLGLLELITVGIAAWALRQVVENGKTLTYVKTKLAVMCNTKNDHESRIRYLERHHD